MKLDSNPAWLPESFSRQNSRYDFQGRVCLCLSQPQSALHNASKGKNDVSFLVHT